MLKHTGTKTLRTNRLILRKFEINDANDMFKNWANDEEVTKYLTWNPHGDISITKSLLEEWVKSYNIDSTYNWVIQFGDTSDIIGGISIVEINEYIQSFEVGYCISKNHWGKGIMSESLKAVIDYLFSQVGCNKITAKHDVRNIASGKVMIKCGMCYIKTLKNIEIPNDKGYCYLHVYEISKKEWKK